MTIPSTLLTNSQNILGKYTYSQVMVESNLHTRVLQNQLIPNLGFYIDGAAVELNHSLENDVPLAEGIEAKSWSTRQMIENHHYLFSFGENITEADCLIPTFGYSWLATRQPICMDMWQEIGDNNYGSSFTSIMNWSGRSPLHYNNEAWGQKNVEFEKFKDLPRSVPGSIFEIVINKPLNKESIFDSEKFRKLGWLILNPQDTVSTPSDYKNFIHRSLGEFSIAKETYVKSRSGWFSCRSACYLAAGKPVVTQETQWSRYIPSGEGLFAFSDLESAIQAIEKINADTHYQSRKAKEIAYEYFDSKLVLSKMLQLLN